jgi:hypothetical protein
MKGDGEMDGSKRNNIHYYSMGVRASLQFSGTDPSKGRRSPEQKEGIRSGRETEGEGEWEWQWQWQGR